MGKDVLRGIYLLARVSPDPDDCIGAATELSSLFRDHDRPTWRKLAALGYRQHTIAMVHGEGTETLMSKLSEAFGLPSPPPSSSSVPDLEDIDLEPDAMWYSFADDEDSVEDSHKVIAPIILLASTDDSSPLYRWLAPLADAVIESATG